MSYNVHFPPWAQQDTWQEGFMRGENPDRFPYGFHHLSSFLPDVRYVSSPSRPFSFRSRKKTLAGLHISWDERSGLSAWLRNGRPRWATGVIWATDGDSGGISPLRKALMKIFLLKCELIWVLSDAQVLPLRDWLGPKCPRVEFLRFGIDTEFFSSRNHEPKTWDLISVGSDVDRERQLLYRAINILAAQGHLRSALIQAPEGEEMPPLVERLERGSAAELREKYTRSRVAVIATRPNLHVSGMTVALECQALGVPVVATYSPGFEDYLDPGTTGSFVGHDEVALAQEIERVLGGNLLSSADQAGPEYVRRHHDSRLMMQALARLIQPEEEIRP